MGPFCRVHLLNSLLVAEDFDPGHLKIAELRGILLKHDVPYTPTAKKAELVQLFQKNVYSKAEEILELHRQLKPNAKGIINLEKKSKGSSKASSKTATVDDEEPDEDDEGKDSNGEESSNAKARREKRAAKSSTVVSGADENNGHE
jgi:hypothetical protein